MNSGNKNQIKKQEHPDETPERQEADQDELLYPRERENEQLEGGSDGSYSEQVDVTRPKPHEFPAFGNAKTDFVSKNLGRKTGRMIGHEPGTEG